jgi:hypothetical protein
MRATVGMFALPLLAACGGSESETGQAEPMAAATLGAGLWELASEVTLFRAVDSGRPKIDTPVGTRASSSVCVGADARPPTAFFAGEGFACSYGAYYVRNGRINVTLSCARAGLPGTIPVSAEGRIDEEGVEFTRSIRTMLASDGDVEITANVTGRRIGDCTHEPDESGGDNMVATG